MPSQLHETLLLLFRNRPELAPDLVRDALHLKLPKYTDVRIDAADFTDLQPAQYRADLVLVLVDESPVLGIVLEVQLSPHEDKPYVWPAYVVNLRARIRCPVCLLVVVTEDRVARWASKRIDLGGENYFVPWVLGLSGVPEIMDAERAKEDPELAVLSAMAHAGDPDVQKSVSIALCAQLASRGLDEERSRLYCDLVLHALPEVARQALREMNRFNYQYQSDFARGYFAEGKAEGRTELVLDLLTTRFGILPAAVIGQLKETPAPNLDAIARRLLSAQTLAEALGQA